MHEPLEGIALADARLGRPFPLPTAALPLARWIEVDAISDGAEVSWNLDDTRPGTPGRLALYAGRAPAPPRDLAGAGAPEQRAGMVWRTAPLEEAQLSLRPVQELVWAAGGLHLRLTAQGPWEPEALVAIAVSIPIGSER